MDSKDIKKKSQDDGHVIFIDRLVDFHIQKDKKEEYSKEKKEKEKTQEK